jgi:hypothetical protein
MRNGRPATRPGSFAVLVVAPVGSAAIGPNQRQPGFGS